MRQKSLRDTHVLGHGGVAAAADKAARGSAAEAATQAAESGRAHIELRKEAREELLKHLSKDDLPRHLGGRCAHAVRVHPALRSGFAASAPAGLTSARR